MSVTSATYTCPSCGLAGIHDDYFTAHLLMHSMVSLVMIIKAWSDCAPQWRVEERIIEASRELMAIELSLSASLERDAKAEAQARRSAHLAKNAPH